MAEEVKTPVLELDRAEIPWVVAYLREDIQDLRNEVRETRRLTLESYEKLDAKMDVGLARLDAKIEELRQDMDAKIKALDAKVDARTDGLDAKIDGLRQDMDAKIERLRQDMDMRFRWTLTTMVAVGAVIVAALKLLP